MEEWEAEETQGGASLAPKSSKFDRHKDDSEEDGDKNDSGGSHANSFVRLTKEQKEEEDRRKKLGKVGRNSQVDDIEWDDNEEEFDLSQNRHGWLSNERNSRVLEDTELVDLGDPLEKEKEEMRMWDSLFEEKTKKLTHVLSFQQKDGGPLQRK
jgi:hypothetical protein